MFKSIAKRRTLKKYLNIEEEFFSVNKETKIASVALSFDSPEDIFDPNYQAKKPILNEHFLGLAHEIFDYIPNMYKIDLTVTFKDMGTWTEQSLKSIFETNMIFEYRAKNTHAKQNDRIALGLMFVGLVMFLGMLWLKHFWLGSALLKEIFSYVADIATTVTFWEALYILVVVRRENKGYTTNLVTRFSDIHFKPITSES